jgi:hypothetical protein
MLFAVHRQRIAGDSCFAGTVWMSPTTMAGDMNPVTRILFLLINYLFVSVLLYLCSNSTIALPIASPMFMYVSAFPL